MENRSQKQLDKFRALAPGSRKESADSARAEKRFLFALPALVLVVGLAVTYALWQNARRDAARALEAEFQFWADKVVYAIEYRLNGNVQVLRGVVGLFDASDGVTRQEFRAYVAALRLEERYPGIQGVGFSRVVPPDQKAAHTAAMRREGFPDYAIYPEGEREIYTSIIYLEPFSGRNLRAFSYDMFSEPVRRAAMARARDENRATLSGKVTLVQETETDVQPGFLIYVPVYRRDAPRDTLEQRRASLLGWAYSPLRMHDLMRSALEAVEFDDLRAALDVEIYDGDRPSLDALMFDSDLAPRVADTRAAFRAVRPIDYGGQQWSVLLASNPVFDARLHGEKARLLAGAGGAGSALLALLVGALAWGQVRVAAALRETARTNKKLVASEARFRSYFEQPLIGVAITSPEKRCIEVNDRLCEMLGYSREELRQRTWAELTHPADLAVEVVQFDRVLAGEIEGYQLEKRIVCRDGRIVPTEVSVSCVREASGRPGYFVGLVQDTTARKEAEDALRQSEILLATGARLAHLGSWVWEIERDVFALSDEWRRIHGCRASTLSMAELEPMAYPDDLPAVRQAFEQALRHGKPYALEHRIVRQDNGEVRFVSAYGEALSDKAGRLVKIIGVAQDITERRWAEDALRESEQRFRTLAALAPVGIYLTDPNGGCLYANARWCEMAGVAATEALGTGWMSALHPEDRDAVMANWQQMVQSEGTWGHEYRFRTPEGKVTWVYGLATPQRDASGRIVRYIGVNLDITERKEAEESLRASLEEKTVLLKEVHHRVKNNLQIVNSLLNLQADRTQVPEVLDTLRDTQNRVRSMALLHEALYRSGSLARIDLPQYVESLCVQLWRTAGPATARVRLDHRVDAVSLPLDQAVPCGLIVNELVSNALKHAFPDGRSGRVRVEAKMRSDRWLALAVADDGVGLPPGQDPRRAETLGLQLVFMLTEQLQGKIEIARDAGTEFRIAFPTKTG